MYRGKTILAVIPARGGSKGIPGKNIKNFLGKPLIYWTIKNALESSYIDRTIVSTDDSNIARISIKCGAQIPSLRSKQLAGDNTPTIDVVLDLLRQLKKRERYIPDFVVLLQPTSPLRKKGDIDQALEILFSNKKRDAVIAVTEVSESPYGMKVITAKGFISDFLPGRKRFTRRQDLPKLYKANGAIYICRTDCLLKEKTFYPVRTTGYIMPKARSIDIDDIVDLRLAEILAKKKISKDRR